MQKQSNSKRYLFQASAIGVAGQITHPFHEIIPVHAASALPDDGGFGTARVDGYRCKEILSFNSAYTQVVGTDEGHKEVFESVAVSVVEGLNILDVVTCDRIVSRVTSKFPGDVPEGSNLPKETAVVPTGSRFEGLRVGNDFVERLELAPDFFKRPEIATWSGLLKALEFQDDRKILEGLSLPGSDGKPAPLPVRGQDASLVGFCIALGQRTESAVLGAPLRISIPQFGTVHLGEFFCYPTARSLTMLRVELGCAYGGAVSAAISRGGGTGYPP